MNISFEQIDSKINIVFNLIQANKGHSQRNWVSRGPPPPPLSQLSYLKVIDLDQYSLYGGWHTQVNDRFSRTLNILTAVWNLIWHIYWQPESWVILR